MTESAPPWQQDTPYDVKVSTKTLRSLTYDVLPPAPSHDTTAAMHDASGAVVVKRASDGIEREFRGRSAKATPLDVALIFDEETKTFELRHVAAATVKLAPPPPESFVPPPKKKPGAHRREPTKRFSKLADGGKAYRAAAVPDEAPDDEVDLVCRPKPKKRPRPKPAPADPTAAPPEENVRSLVKRAAPIAVVQANPKRGASGERFAKYMAATTAAEYVELGGTPGDLRHDIKKGFVTVLDRSPAPAVG